MDGSKLSIGDVSGFLRKRDGALQALSRRIEEPYQVTRAKLRRAFRQYTQRELDPWWTTS